jgi:hypothetical protein
MVMQILGKHGSGMQSVLLLLEALPDLLGIMLMDVVQI